MKFNVIETADNEGELVSQFLCGDDASKHTKDLFNIQQHRLAGSVLVAINKEDDEGVKNLINIDQNVIEEIVKLTKHTYWMKAILEENGFVKAPKAKG